MDAREITPDAWIEDIVRAFPHVVVHFKDVYGISVVQCGEPLWVNLAELARTHDLDPDEMAEGVRRFLLAETHAGR